MCGKVQLSSLWCRPREQAGNDEHPKFVEGGHGISAVCEPKFHKFLENLVYSS